MQQLNLYNRRQLGAGAAAGFLGAMGIATGLVRDYANMRRISTDAAYTELYDFGSNAGSRLAQAVYSGGARAADFVTAAYEQFGPSSEPTPKRAREEAAPAFAMDEDRPVRPLRSSITGPRIPIYSGMRKPKRLTTRRTYRGRRSPFVSRKNRRFSRRKRTSRPVGGVLTNTGACMSGGPGSFHAPVSGTIVSDLTDYPDPAYKARRQKRLKTFKKAVSRVKRAPDAHHFRTNGVSVGEYRRFF